MKLDYSQAATRDVLTNLRAQMREPGNRDPERLFESHAKVEFVKDHLQRVEIRKGKYVIFGDEPKSVAGLGMGGTNSAPAPFEYFVAGFAMCAAAQYLWQIADLDVKVDDFGLEATAVGKWTPILPDGVDEGTHTALITVTVYIESAESSETILELARLAHLHCPAHQSLTHEVPIRTEVVLNAANVGAFGANKLQPSV
jgi:uncharacterized OsmC-like protein